MNCKVIAIEYQKGGTGKSTTALNLGVGLKMKGKNVLLIDADPQGCGCPVDTSAVGRSTDRAGRRDSLSISLGIKRPDELDVSLATLMSKVIDNKPFNDDYGIIHCNEGVDLMPCNVELSGIESYLFTVMSRECIMRSYVNQVKKNYDYILIDCTPSLGLLPINAFVAADSIIVPSQPRILSTKGLDLLLRIYSQVKRGINPDLKIDGMQNLPLHKGGFFVTLCANRSIICKMRSFFAVLRTKPRAHFYKRKTSAFTQTFIRRENPYLRPSQKVLGIVKDLSQKVLDRGPGRRPAHPRIPARLRSILREQTPRVDGRRRADRLDAAGEH